VLLGKRLGLMSAQGADGPTKDFVTHAVSAISILGSLTNVAPKHGMKRPEYAQFLKDWARVSELGAQLLDESEKNGQGVLARALKSDATARDRLVADLTGLLAAGVDTTSSVFQNTVYAISRYPHVQRKLREEIVRVCGPPGTPLTGDLLRACHYLRAVSREVHRKHYVVNGNSRVCDVDIALSTGHVLPKDSFMIFSMGLAEDPEYVKGDPALFLPERWLGRDGQYVRVRSAEEKEDDPNLPAEGETLGEVSDYVDLVDGAGLAPRKVPVRAPHTKIRHALYETPFGVGPRQCIGGRLATLEVHSFIVECLRHFELGAPNPKTEHKQNLVRMIAPDPLIKFTKL